MKKIIIGIIRFYKIALSPYLSWHCRYDPTCSQYMIDAIEHYGVIRGVGKGLKRLGRCHPWQKLGGGHGYDPVIKPNSTLPPESNCQKKAPHNKTKKNN